MPSATLARTGAPVSRLGTDRRAAFIQRTYAHLFAAILAFTAFEVAMFRSGLAERFANLVSGVSWLFVLGAFMIVSWFASRIAWRARSPSAQYAALATFVVAEVLLFIPLLYHAERFAEGTIKSAAVVTLLGFTGLSAVAFVTRQDFSFLRGLLRWGFVIALVLIVASLLFGFHLGTWFSVAMVGLAGAAVLYDTDKVLHRYPADRHVGAALELFASVALMLWYVLRLFMSRD